MTNILNSNYFKIKLGEIVNFKSHTITSEKIKIRKIESFVKENILVDTEFFEITGNLNANSVKINSINTDNINAQSGNIVSLHSNLINSNLITCNSLTSNNSVTTNSLTANTVSNVSVLSSFNTAPSGIGLAITYPLSDIRLNAKNIIMNPTEELFPISKIHNRVLKKLVEGEYQFSILEIATRVKNNVHVKGKGYVQFAEGYATFDHPEISIPLPYTPNRELNLTIPTNSLNTFLFQETNELFLKDTFKNIGSWKSTSLRIDSDVVDEIQSINIELPKIPEFIIFPELVFAAVPKITIKVGPYGYLNVNIIPELVFDVFPGIPGFTIPELKFPGYQLPNINIGFGELTDKLIKPLVQFLADATITSFTDEGNVELDESDQFSFKIPRDGKQLAQDSAFVIIGALTGEIPSSTGYDTQNFYVSYDYSYIATSLPGEPDTSLNTLKVINL
jgi:hypothetical protein